MHVVIKKINAICRECMELKYTPIKVLFLNFIQFIPLNILHY